ncbi:MAG: hypothetical protein WCP35_12745, partial [Verrucomicrobiota bacterium]
NPRPHPYQGCALPLSYASYVAELLASFDPTKTPRPVRWNGPGAAPLKRFGEERAELTEKIAFVKKNLIKS